MVHRKYDTASTYDYIYDTSGNAIKIFHSNSQSGDVLIGELEYKLVYSEYDPPYNPLEFYPNFLKDPKCIEDIF